MLRYILAAHKPTFFEVIWSVLAAMFGVQSKENRERDFTKGNPWAYIIVGIICTTIFVLLLIFVVKLVLSQSY